MTKRPLHPRFREQVLAGKKTTTIRDNAWPVGVPIMLYQWSGAAYRSKQIDVAPVIVEQAHEIRITHREDGGMVFAFAERGEQRIHETEGFASRAELDAWFRPLVRRGETETKVMMHFRIIADIPA